jgi:EmrB/QacA subfamily drug resistance transporter
MLSSQVSPAQQAGFWVLTAAILASSMAFIDGTALNVALPALQKDLEASGTSLLWIMNAYALPLAAFILVGGVLGDRLGRKRVFMTGIATFTVASLACGLASSTGLLIAARAIQGLGAALMVPGSLSIISASFEASKRGQAIGTWSAFSTLTTILGPVLGGVLAEAGLWRGVFFINLPIATVSVFILARRVPESYDEHAPAQIDYIGGLLAIVGLAALTFGFIQAGEGELNYTLVIITVGMGMLTLLVFVLVEARSTHPMVNLALFKSRTFSGTNLMTLFLYAALSGGLFFVPLNLVQVQGYQESQAGFALLPFALLLTAMSRWAGGLVDRLGPRLPLVIGPSIVGVGFLLFALVGLTAGPVDYWLTFFPGAITIGIGMGITVAPLTTAVMGSVSSQKAGVASGVNNAIARTAGVLAVATMGAVALLAFSNRLESRADSITLSSEARNNLQDEAVRLAQAKVPDGLSPETETQVQNAIKLAFVDAFQLVSFIAAGLCWLSALLAGLMVEKRMAMADSISTSFGS